MAFPHHPVQERIAQRPPAWPARANISRYQARNAVADSENIVVETAEKTFADLADVQGVTSDKAGAWKAPLWQALAEAGPVVVWGGGGGGGAGGLPRDG